MKNRLEELRKARGIKQEELAEALEVSRQTIGSLENGRYNPCLLYTSGGSGDSLRPCHRLLPLCGGGDPAGGVSLRAGRLPGGAVRHGGDEGR